MFPKLPCECGGKIRIIDVRTRVDDRVYRRHRCMKCGATYRTVEIRIEEYVRVKNIEEYVGQTTQQETMK